MKQHTQETYGMRPEAERFPMMVVLSFIYVCNAGCPNCPYNNSDIRSKYSDCLYMPEELFKKTADECGPHGSLLRLSGGGEPMLHPQAVHLMEYAKAKGCKVGLITNGSRFTEDNLHRLLAAGVDAIEFSVDAGDEETYAEVRPRLDWKRLNESVLLARRLRDSMRSPTRLICSVINQRGVDVAAAETYWQNIIDKVQIRKFLTWGYNKKLSADETPYLPPEDRLPCPWLFERINIDTRGDVTLCGEDIAFAERFANIRGGGATIADVWLGSHFSALRKKHLERKGHEIPICSQCPDWQYRSWQYNYWKVLHDADERRIYTISKRES
jgi:pyruvate-formate lyase-activating enzyme